MEKREGERVPENGDRLRNNDFLTALDFDALSDEQLTDLLQQIIDNELNKPEEEADLSLVNACDALLGDLEREKTGEAEKIAVPETPEEAEQREKESLQRIYAKARLLESAEKRARKGGKGKGKEKKKEEGKRKAKTKVGGKGAKPRRKKLLRFVVAFAAVFLLLSSSFTIIASVSGFSISSEWFDLHIREILNLPPGKHDIEGITVQNAVETKEYASIEEWIKETGLEIMYPTVLPEGVKIEEISHSTYGEGEYDIEYIFNSPKMWMHCCNFDLSQYRPQSGNEIYRFGNFEFEIQPAPIKGYQASAVFNEIAYVIVADEYDDLILVIQNLKGIKK